MPSIVYPRPNRKGEILSAARPACQLICPLWLFSILFTKGKHIFKTPFCLIKNAWKFGDTVYSQDTWLIHNIYLEITESERICAQPHRATWVPTLCLLLCYAKIWGSQASCAHCQILPHSALLPSLLLILQVQPRLPFSTKFPWMPKEQNLVP